MDLVIKVLTPTEVDPKFMQGMADRMEVSYAKYGAVQEGAPRVDVIASLMARLRLYTETGNTEWLMDVANFAMIEHMYPKHPNAHFRGTDSDESPGRISATTGVASSDDNRHIGRNYVSPMADFR